MGSVVVKSEVIADRRKRVLLIRTAEGLWYLRQEQSCEGIGYVPDWERNADGYRLCSASWFSDTEENAVLRFDEEVSSVRERGW